MNSNNVKIRIVLSLLLILVVILQTTLVPRMDILGAVLNLPILFVVLVSLFRGAGSGYAWGLAAGLFIDLLAGKFIGLNMISLLLCGFFSGILFAKNYKTNFLIPIAATGAGGFIYSVVYLLLLRFAGVTVNFFSDLFVEMLPMLIYTAAMSLPVYIICYIVHQHKTENQFGSFE